MRRGPSDDNRTGTTRTLAAAAPTRRESLGFVRHLGGVFGGLAHFWIELGGERPRRLGAEDHGGFLFLPSVPSRPIKLGDNSRMRVRPERLERPVALRQKGEKDRENAPSMIIVFAILAWIVSLRVG
jgi:hypothetical protein